MQAWVECGTVVWPGETDVAPETLYERSVRVQFSRRRDDQQATR